MTRTSPPINNRFVVSVSDWRRQTDQVGGIPLKASEHRGVIRHRQMTDSQTLVGVCDGGMRGKEREIERGGIQREKERQREWEKERERCRERENTEGEYRARQRERGREEEEGGTERGRERYGERGREMDIEGGRERESARE